MGLSNYPPGVTGRELEIAGPDWEGEIEATCGTENVELQVLCKDDIATLKIIAGATGAQGSGKRRDADVIQQAMRRAFSRMETITLPTCTFEGEVFAWGYQGITHWACPVCGTEHEREPQYDGPDRKGDE